MNKLYFTKYLPVEGEIKEGDAYQINGQTFTLSGGHFNNPPNRLILKKYPEVKTHGEWINKVAEKVKLFLCSKDIQIGDKPYNKAGKELEHPVSDIDLDILKELEAFKVIGEISPEASWVKEGDEFDEYQESDTITTGNVRRYSKGEVLCVKVKGPCGHFH
jgi:hypothetical protein